MNISLRTNHSLVCAGKISFNVCFINRIIVCIRIKTYYWQSTKKECCLCNFNMHFRHIYTIVDFATYTPEIKRFTFHWKQNKNCNKKTLFDIKNNWDIIINCRKLAKNQKSINSKFVLNNIHSSLIWWFYANI